MRQAKMLEKAKVRMMKQKGSDQTESYWSNLWGKPRDYQNTAVVDAYALIGDVSGLAEKIQSFFMQEVLSVAHSVLKNILQE
ncbi:unnamed protein product [Camellia sinensis]